MQSVASDSRNIVKNQLFVGIKGEHFDGNTFALEAITTRCCGSIGSRMTIRKQVPAVVVADTRLALGQLAKHWRQKFKLPLVAITGSNGKTTVKEMVAAILSGALTKAFGHTGQFE